jgi:hypothetical protein
VQPAIGAPCHRNQSPSGEREKAPAPAKAGVIAVTRAILRPANGSAEARRAEIVGVEDLLDKNTKYSLEGAEYVVHGDNGPVGEMGLEHVEIRLRPFVRVITVYPEKPNGVFPLARELVRVRALDLDAFDDAGPPEVSDEVFVGCRFAAEIRIRARGRGVRIHRDDRTQSQLARHVSNSHGRSALEASDFEILSPRGRQRGRGHDQPRLSLGEIAGRRGNAMPPLIDDRRDMVEIVLSRQNSS